MLYSFSIQSLSFIIPCFQCRNRFNRSTPEDDDVVSINADFSPAVITGLRVEEADKGVTYDGDGASVVLAGTPVTETNETVNVRFRNVMLCFQVTVRLFGYDFSEDSEFRFALGARERGADCGNLPFTVTVRVLKSLLSPFICSIANPYDDTNQLTTMFTFFGHREIKVRRHCTRHWFISACRVRIK